MQPPNIVITTQNFQQPALASQDSVSVAIEKADKPKLIELIGLRTPLETGDFAALCLDFPDVALLALKQYTPSELPKALPNRTLTLLGFNVAHEELLTKLIEANMCEKCPTLIHTASANGYYNVVQMLIGRGANVLAPDEFGNTPRYYAEKIVDANITNILLDQEKKLLIKSEHATASNE